MTFIKLNHTDVRLMIMIIESCEDPLPTEEMELLNKLRQILKQQIAKARSAGIETDPQLTGL